MSSLHFLVILFCITGCTPSLPSDAYINYVTNEKNGLNVAIQVNGWKYQVQYRPYDYILLLENRGVLDKTATKARKAELEGTVWFTITIERADTTASVLRYGHQSDDAYNSRLDYYLNKAQKDIALLYGDLQLPVMSYLFENSHNLLPKETMVVGFALPSGEKKAQKQMRLSFVDKALNTGAVTADFYEHSILNIPTIDY